MSLEIEKFKESDEWNRRESKAGFYTLSRDCIFLRIDHQVMHLEYVQYVTPFLPFNF